MPTDLSSPRDLLRSKGAQYAFAVLLLAISTGVRVSLTPILGDRLPYLFFFVAVVVVSWTCDVYPALVVLVGTMLATNYFFLPPHGRLTLSGQAVLFGSLYLAAGLAIVYVGQAQRRSAKALQEQKEWLHTTLTSIGDGVIATDADGLITLMNPVAEKLTGWTLKEAQGKAIADVFRIVNQQTRQTAENPVDKVRRLNGVAGLANHTMLISRNGQEIAIDDSGAPILGPDETMSGVILVFRDVTQQRAQEAALLESHAKLAEQAGLLDLAYNSILVQDGSGHITYWNRGAEELYGWTREEALGKVIHDLLKTGFPEPLTSILAQVHDEKHWEGELVHTHKSGERLTVLSRWALVPVGEDASGAVLEITTDITRRKQAEEAVKAQREWLHTTLTSIGDAVIATDANGLITLMNPVAEKLTEWDLEQAKGKPLTEVFRIINQQTRETVENPVDKVRRLNRVVGLANHTILISKSGQELAIDDSGAPIFDANGVLAGVVLVFRDVTQQRALEAALQSNERLALAGRLSASIAHEIHNPLDTVGSILFLLGEQTNDDPASQRLIATAQSEVQRVVEISKNMLSLHRESRAASPVRISELLEGVVSLIEETIAKGRRKIRLEHGFDGEIEGFQSELRQVFTNVIKNAVEATAEGGEIAISSEPADESVRTGVVVHVADNGVGIPQQVLAKLFSPFVSTKEESGTGLGLWVSRSILEKHRGTIRVASSTQRPNHGTTVSIFLPLGATRKKPVDAASAAHGDSG